MWKYSPLKTILILGPMVFSFALAMDIYMPVLPEMQKFSTLASEKEAALIKLAA